MRPKYPEVFSDRLIELRKEKEYWKLMTKKKVAISHQGLKLRWAGHQPAFKKMRMEQRKKMLKKWTRRFSSTIAGDTKIGRFSYRSKRSISGKGNRRNKTQ